MAGDRVLLLGAAGQLGHELGLCLQRTDYAVTALTRHELDLSDLLAVRQHLRQVQPRWIINAAAYTAVDKAEQEPQLAHTLNAELPGLLATLARAQGAALVHYSSDYVFNGQAQRPYLETDATDPQSVYGRSKRDGDLAVHASGARHLIFRSSWVVGAHGHNFLKTMLRLAMERDSLRVVADQKGVPTAAAWLADITLAAMRLSDEQGLMGLFHATPTGQTHWQAYAQHVLEQALQLGWRLKATPQKVEPITTAQYPLPAVRPAYGLLDSSLLAQTLKLPWPNWQTGVDKVMRQLAETREDGIPSE
jgi:dTDP-4-dehydrorhamnose reductase